MPRQTEHSGDPGTLPAPELNPLLNPVLGQNMGRWAEVYFTSPPEKREQAVLDLLRELEAKEPGPEDRFTAPPSWTPEPTSSPVGSVDSKVERVQSTKVRCHSCGRALPASQKYCGMCGARQARAEETIVSPLQEARLPEERRIEPAARYDKPQDWREPQSVLEEHDSYEPRSGRNELSLFQSGDSTHYSVDDDDEIFSYAPPSRPYRVYVGILLAIVILVLGYMAWRSAQATSQSAHVEPQAPPPVATQPAMPAPEPTAPTASRSDAADRTSPAEKESAVSAPHSAHSVDPKTFAKTNADQQSRTETPLAASDAQKRALADSQAGNGSQELAIALRYLNGSDGERQNRAEAAKWLWKAMAKHNGSATLLLADLYLKGDGVSKNCDQARVLLDSAARGGMKQAGERLRHLQAFGCE